MDFVAVFPYGTGKKVEAFGYCRIHQEFIERERMFTGAVLNKSLKFGHQMVVHRQKARKIQGEF